MENNIIYYFKDNGEYSRNRFSIYKVRYEAIEYRDFKHFYKLTENNPTTFSNYFIPEELVYKTYIQAQCAIMQYLKGEIRKLDLELYKVTTFVEEENLIDYTE